MSMGKNSEMKYMKTRMSGDGSVPSEKMKSHSPYKLCTSGPERDSTDKMTRCRVKLADNLWW